MGDEAPDYRAKHPVMRALRVGMRVLGTVSPRVAGRVAFELYHTPRSFRPRPHEVEVLRDARRFSIPLGGAPLAAYEWGRGERTVVLMHGWEGRAGQLGAFVSPLVAGGFRVVAFDGPAHGSSPGRRADTEGFAAGLLETQKRCGPLYAAIAHSMGATSVMYAQGQGLRLERAVFLAPMALSTEPLRKFVAIAGIVPAVERDLRRRIELAYGKEVWRRFELPTLVGRPTASLLVLHDRNDRDVSFNEGEALAAAWPSAELVLTSGLGHRRILRDADVVRRAIDFVGRAATHAPRPSARA